MAPTKRPRTVQAKNVATFQSAEQLIEALRLRNPEVLRNSLVSFRNQITVSHGERPSSDDARVVLVTAWLHKSPGASELFDIWDTGSNYTSLVLVTLSHTIQLISGTHAASPHGASILRVLFDSTHARRLNAHLASGQTDVVLAALKVLNAAASIDQKSTYETVAWTAKALPKLLSHRHRTPTSQPLAHPSIRTALTTLLLALLPHTLSLELFTALFKGLAQDDGVVVKLVLEACWEKVWCDVKVSKSLKVKVFGGLGVFIQPLYERTEPDSTEPLAPADVVHHFLLALCTRPGAGLCFRSKGWYPRPAGNPLDSTEQILDLEKGAGASGRQPGENDQAEGISKGTVYNPLLLKLLRFLRPSADMRQHELAVRILNACPDLIGAYFAKGAAQLGLSLDPRLSTRWITSVGFVVAVIDADVPVDSFYLDTPAHSLTSSRAYRAAPPPLDAIVENIIPSVLTRAWLTKGLLTRSTQPQSADSGEPTQPTSSAGGLVQHTTIRLLTRCLLKLAQVTAAFPSEPAWTARAMEVVDAVRRRVPELGVVVGVSQEATRCLERVGKGGEEVGEVEGEGVRGLLVAEGALRLLWLYARVLPGAMAETRFDVGKLLQETEVDTEVDTDADKQPGTGLKVMCQILMLRLIGESDQFVWSAKPAGSSHTLMFRLLSLHLYTPHAQLRAASEALIVRLLGASVLFEHDPREARAWVGALPRMKSEIASFLAFFEDALARCVKTPYRYLENGTKLYGVPNATAADVSRMPSPLFMAVLEQLKNKPMDARARRTVAAFVSRLLKSLVGKMSLESAKAIVGYMRDVFAGEGEESPGKRVVGSLSAFLDELELVPAAEEMDVVSSAAAVRFVDEAETQMAAAVVGDGDALKLRAAENILDQFLNSGEGFGVAEVVRLVQVFVTLSVDGVALGELLEEIDWRKYLVLGLELDGIWDSVSSAISFSAAFRMSLIMGLDSVSARNALTSSLVRQPNELLVWSCGLVAHRLAAAAPTSSTAVVQECLNALVLISQRIKGAPEATEVKQMLFAEMEVMKALINEPTWITHVGEIVELLLSSTVETDCALAAPYSEHWSRCLLEATSEGEFKDSVVGFAIWIPFTPSRICVHVFETALERVSDWSSVPEAIQTLLEQLARYLLSSTLDRAISVRLANTLPRLIQIPVSSQCRSLLKLAPAIAERELPLGFDLASIDPSESLARLTERARSRWGSNTGVLRSMSLAGFSGWVETDELARFSTAVMYQSASARAAFSAWVGEQSSLPSRAIGPCFAVMDCQAALVQENPDQERLPEAAVTRILDCASRLLFKHGETTEHQRWAAQTLINAVHTLPNELDRIVRVVTKRAPSNPRDAVQRHALSFISWAVSQSSHWEKLVDSIVDSALLWLVRRFAEDESDSSELLAILPDLESLLLRASNIKPHLAEPVLIAAVKNRLQVPVVMKLCLTLVVRTPLKPASVNKLLQSIIHHTSFPATCLAPSPAKDGAVGLLHSLFHKHPSSTCHPSQIIPLLSVYRATLDRSDTQILSIFQLFEKSRQMSTLAILSKWTPDPSLAPPKDLIEVVCNLDPTTTFRTCTSFPQRRDLQHTELLETDESRSDTYDPIFVLSLLAALMVSDEPITNMQWVNLCRTNVLSLAVSSLSSKRPAMRQLGYASLVTAYARLPDVEFQERAQLLYTLDLLRNMIPPPSASPSTLVTRLPTYTTLLLSHALRGIFAPSTPLYPLISRFLLQRPEFDTKDVPMLYTLLYSSSGEWKRERGWILRFLADGMRSTEDWRVLKRRHTWDLLASLYQSAAGDRTLRLSILEFLANASTNKHAATSLLLGSSILSWMRMQLDTVLPGEDLAYLKIIENMAIVVDHAQIESATMGIWRDSIAQIICRLVQNNESESSIPFLASRILLRLSTSITTIPSSFSEGVKLILSSLDTLETSLTAFPNNGDLILPLPMHTSRNILHPIPGTVYAHWRLCIHALWSVAMNMRSIPPRTWVNLTSKTIFMANVDVEAEVAGCVSWARCQARRILLVQ